MVWSLLDIWRVYHSAAPGEESGPLNGGGERTGERRGGGERHPPRQLTPLVWNKLKDRAKALRITVETETRHW
jgi:hypothetical protein